MKDKLVLLFPDGVGIRNYLYSEVFKNSEKELILLHSFDANTIKDIGKHAAFSDAHKIPVYKESFLEKFLRELICLARLKHNAKIRHNKTILANWNPSKNSFPKKIFYFLVTIASFFVHNYAFILKLEKYYQQQIRKNTFYQEVYQLLKQIAPKHLFCSHQRAVNCATIFAAASDLKITTTTVIYSWDNLPKARLALRADQYLVWSNYMLDEMQIYYPEIPKEKIFVTGTPQFEFYLEDANVIPKEIFYKKYHLDPAKKIICFSGDDTLTSPDDPSYLKDVAEQIVSNKLEAEYQILFRRCPVDFTGRYDAIVSKYASVIKEAAPIWNFHSDASFATAYPSPEDVQLLVSTAKYSDIVINVGSTMAFDFAMYNKPCIFIHYDQEIKQNKKWSTKLIYQFQHFKSMPSSKAVLWITKKEDLVPILKNKSNFEVNAAIHSWKDEVLGTNSNVSLTIKKIVQ